MSQNYMVIAVDKDKLGRIGVNGPYDLETALKNAKDWARSFNTDYQLFKLVETHYIKPRMPEVIERDPQ